MKTKKKKKKKKRKKGWFGRTSGDADTISGGGGDANTSGGDRGGSGSEGDGEGEELEMADGHHDGDNNGLAVGLRDSDPAGYMDVAPTPTGRGGLPVRTTAGGHS
jgi:hypothetical protein